MSGDLRALRAYAWSMSRLPGMPPIAPPAQRRGTCESCGGGTYKGRSTCLRCENSQAVLARRLARPAPVQRPGVSCWICGKPMASKRRAAPRMPTCSACTAKHGAYVCAECGGPKRTAAPGSCRACTPVRPKAGPGICKLCEEPYVPKPNARPDQRWCSKSCAQAWRNGARPPYTRVADGDYKSRKLSRNRHRLRVHAETWDGITDAAILERDRWRCGICRTVIGKMFKWPHPRSASIDHIVPLSEGGDDTAGNKRAAHLACNCGRMNRGGGEQAALF